MNRLVKLLVLSFCLVACGAGALFVPVDSPAAERDKLNITPVKNHEPARRIWIQA